MCQAAATGGPARAPVKRRDQETMRSDAVFDVAIGGGGTVGLALACALADALGGDARIALVDLGDLSAAGGGDIRASALSAASKRLLATLGVWPAIAEAA